MSEKEIIRRQRWRLGIIRHAEEVTKNIAKTCRYFGISRATYYHWQSKYEKEGIDGLRDKSRRPLHSPRETKTEIVAEIPGQGIISSPQLMTVPD